MNYLWSSFITVRTLINNTMYRDREVFLFLFTSYHFIPRSLNDADDYWLLQLPIISRLANDDAASYFCGSVFRHFPADILHYRCKKMSLAC